MQPLAQRTFAAPTRLTKWLYLLLGIALACVFVCGGIYLWLERPHYLIEDIPLPDSHLWSTTETIVQKWEGDGSSFFIWRREAMLFQRCGQTCQPWTWQAVIDYFDHQLSARGWERVEHQPDTPCNVFLAESNFLDEGSNGYVVYKHPNSPVYHWTPTICLAVWPSGADNPRDFHIVFLTAQPSSLTAIADGLG
jgi:hypothetical protein